MQNMQVFVPFTKKSMVTSLAKQRLAEYYLYSIWIKNLIQ